MPAPLCGRRVTLRLCYAAVHTEACLPVSISVSVSVCKEHTIFLGNRNTTALKGV